MTQTVPYADGIRPKGLLSFLYNAVFDPDTNQNCHEDIQGTMKFFGLSEQEQAAITAAQDAGQPDPEALEKVANLLVAELAKGYSVIW